MVQRVGIKAVDGVRFVFFGLVLLATYYTTLRWLVTVDWEYEDYNHAWLMPLVVLYLLWDRRQLLAETPGRPSWMGALPFAAGVVLFWLGELGGEFFTHYISLWLIIVGVTWMYIGWEKIKKVAFSLILILAMFPLPSFLYTKVSFQLKLISSQLGVKMIQAYGMSAFREGNVIDLGFTQLQVVDACSGLRFLIPLIILGFLLAYFFKAHWWKRIVLVMTTVPLSVITNSLRIALTGILYETMGAEAAEGFFHGFSGWFIFMFTLAILLIEMWILKKLPPRESSVSVAPHPGGKPSEPKSLGEESGDIRENTEPKPTTPALGGSGLAGLFRPAQGVVAAVVLLIILGLSQGVEFREKIPPSKAFTDFPIQVGEYEGTRQTMEERFLSVLDLSEYVMIDYKDTKGRIVNFYLAYYETQRKGESIHSPETCLPGSGWIFKEAGDKIIETPGSYGGRIKTSRAVMEKNELQQLSYFFFPARGRILQNVYQMKIYTFWDALTKQRTDGALVRMITPLYPGEKMSDADERLQTFVKEMAPVLTKYLPGSNLASGEPVKPGA